MGPDLPAPLIGGPLAPAFGRGRGAGHEVEPELPLLAGQTAAWLDARSFPNKPVYTTGQAVAIASDIDRERFAAALALAVDECDALRVRLRLDRPTAQRETGAPGLAALPLVDLTAEDDPEAAARRWMEAEFRRPFRLDDFPLCRFALLRLAPERHVWFMAFHQLVMDAIGRELFTARVADLYAALRGGGRPAPRPSPTLAAVRAGEDAYFSSPRAARDRAYWLARLKDLPDALVQSDPHLTERTRSGRAARSAFTLPAERADAVRAAAAGLGVTAARLLTAIGAIAFARWYEDSDLVLGVTLGRRQGARLRHGIGPFSQTLPLRVSVDRHATLGEAIGSVARLLRRDQRHRHYPIHELRAPLGLSRQARRFADVTLTYLPTAYGFAFDGAPLRVENLSYGFTGPWAVTWVDAGTGTGITTTVDYDPGVVQAFEAEQVAEALRCLLEGAPNLLGLPVGALPMMRPTTLAEVLRWSTGETMPVPGEATLASLFAAQSRQTPDAIALVVGEERLSYAALHEQAAQLAARLAAAGVRRGSVVGLALPRTAAQLLGVLAVHMVGAAYLPLDPGFPAERLAFMCVDARADLVLTTAAHAATLPKLPCRVARIDAAADLPPPAAWPDYEAPSADDLAYVLYTSGSTGRPKGVGVEHGSLVNFVFWVRSLADTNDLSGVLFSTPLGFDISAIEIFMPLSFGGRIVMVENILALPAAPARAEVRLISTVPSLLEALLRVHGLPAGLRTVFMGGEALQRGLADRLLVEAPELKVANLYGPTEATVYASWARLHPGESGPPPIGRPIWNSSLYVLDPDGAPLPPGAAGELWIAGTPVARGYLGRPDLTEARFRPDPFRRGRMYRTGDRARWRPDRQLEFLGRLDDQIKINGVRIELGEIEAALLQQPGVAAAAVALRADDGGPRNHLVGWLVAAAGGAAAPRDLATLRADLRALLPDTMIPTSFVWVETLPLTPNGKLDRRALRSPPPVQVPARPAPLEIRTPMEQAVAKLWGQVLQKPDLAADDDFFELGGDSLAAVNLLSQVEMRFGVRLTTDVLAEGLTVGRLARLIETEDSAEQPGLALALQPLGDGAPFYCVPGIGGDPTHLRALARRMGTDRPFIALRGGLPPSVDQPDRIEDIAARYAEALLARHTGGPILLGGYSLGAAIAYEMAHQLRLRGRRPALLALIDTRRPDWALTTANAPATLWQILCNLPHWVRDDLLPGGLDAFVRNLRRHMRVLRSRSASLDRVLDTTRYSPQQQQTMERYHRALATYRPASHPGRVVVLRARAQPLLWWFSEPTLGWRKLAQGGVELHRLPGNHATIMSDPIVQHLADRLRACIARCQGGPSAPPPARATAAAEAHAAGPTSEPEGGLSPA